MLPWTRRTRAPTYSDTRWPPRCFGREPLWARSDSCCVMHIRTLPRFTRRSMSRHCVRWHYAGRGVGDEIPQTSGAGLYSDAAGPRLQDAASGAALETLRFLHGGTKSLLHYNQAGAKVGNGAGRRATRHLGRTADVRTRFCALLQRCGSAHGGSTAGHFTFSPATGHTVPLQRGGNSAADGGGPMSTAKWRSTGVNLPLPLRTPHSHRFAYQ